MAILASIEVDDEGSLKIKNFRDALSDLGASVVKAREEFQKSNRDGSKSSKEQADALTQLTAAHRAALAEQQKYGAGFSVLQQQMKAGTTVTQVQAAALQQLATQTQSNTQFSAQYGAALANLSKTMAAGTTVTAQQAAQLQQVVSGHNGAATATKQHTNSLEQFNIQAAAAAAALGLFAGGLYSFLRGAAEAAARIQTLGVVLNVVGKNAGISRLELQTQIEGVKALGITTREATDTVLQFVQAQLKASDASKIARAAQDLAVVAGENSSQTVQRLTQAIQTGETMLLRQVGIVTTNEAIWREYAKTVGKNVNQLDALDKKQAMVNKILSEAGKVAGAYEQSMGTAGKQLTSFARYTEEAELKLGQALVPALGLGIRVATELLKIFMALSPETMKLVSALLAAAAAMALFSAAIAGAKLVGLIGLVATLATNIGYVTLAIQNGMGVWTSLVGIFGPWGLAIAGITLAIGALTAAYIYFNKEMDMTVDKEVQAAAVSQSRIDTLTTTTEKVITLGQNTNKTTGEQTLYNQAIQTLNKLAPEAVTALGDMKNRYDQMVPAIQAVIDKEYERMRVQARILGDKKEAAEAERKAADAEMRAADERVKAVKAQLAGAKAGQQPTIEFDVEGRTFKAAVSVETLKNNLVNAQKAAAEASDKFNATSLAVDTITKAFDGLNEALPENVLKRGQRMAAEVANEFRETEKTITNLKARLKVAGKSEDYLTNAVDVPMFRQRLTEVNAAWDKHVKQMETDAKKTASAIKSFYASIRDSDPIDMGKYKAASVLLKEVGEDTEEYGRRVQKLRPILDAYAKSSDPAVKGIKELQKALDTLTTKAYEDALEKGVLANEKLAESLNDKLVDSVRNASKELLSLQLETDKKAFDQRLAQADRIEEVNRSIYEADVVSKMSAVDQAIYAERKRMEAIEKGYAREKLMRDRALQQERDAVDRKAELAKEEVQIFVDKINREAELQLQLQRNKVSNMQPGLARELAEAELRAAERTREMDRKTLSEYQANQFKQIESHRAAQQKILDQQAAVNKEIDASNAGLAAKQKAASDRAVAEIIKNFAGVKQAAIALSKSIVLSFIDGLMQMGPGAKSFKDVLVGVFDSIKKTFSNMVNQMVQNWIEGLFKMKAAENATGGGGTAGGASGKFSLFGKGQSTGQKALGGAAVGFMAGDIAGRYADGSYAKGALGGAASGAAAGAAVGGWVGAGVGAIAGGIAGFMQARAQRKQMQEDRDQLVKDMGGLEAFKKKAQEAGFAYDKLLSTKSPKEFGAEIKKLQEALDKLGLKKSREELIATSGGLLALSKSMELVGFNSKVLFETKSVTEYNAEVEKLNKLLEDQQKRITALGSAAGGLDTAVKGMSMRLDRALSDITKKMPDDMRKALEENFKKATEAGFKGSQNDWLRQMELLPQAGMVKNNPKLLEGSDAALKAFIEAQKGAQKEFNQLGLVATATFSQILSETGDIVQAMNAVGPALDQMIALQKDWGLEADGAFQKLLQFRQVLVDNEDIATSLSGITQILKGLSEAGALTAEIFNAMGSDAATLFQTLLDRGVDSNQAMLMMQPTLQALWEAQKEFGFQTDEATQALLDQAVAAGMVGEKQQSINKQMLDVLLMIAKVLGADIPTAYQNVKNAASGAGGSVDGLTDKVRDAEQAWRDMGDAAEQAGKQAEDGATGAAEGHSPTGVKQIIVRLKESMDAFQAFKDQAVNDSGSVEDAAASAAEQMAMMQKIRESGVDKDSLRSIYAQARAANYGADPTKTDTVKPQTDSTASTVQPVPNLTIQIAPEFNISALDGSDVERVIRETAGPELLQLAINNTDQFAVLFEEALARRRRE